MSGINDFWGGGGSYEPRIKKNELDISELGRYTNPNLLINGDLTVNQRGRSNTNPLPNLTWVKDRWRFITTRNDIDFTQGVNYRTGSFLGFRCPVTNDDAISIRQAIEIPSPSEFVGSEITISFKYYHDAPMDHTIILSWKNATTGSVGSSQRAGVHTIGGSGVDSFTMVIHDIDVSASDGDEIALEIGVELLGFTSNVAYRYYWVKAELGSEATSFIPDNPATNLANCQRYYENWIGNYAAAPYSTTGTSNANIYQTFVYKVTKRSLGELNWTPSDASTGSVTKSLGGFTWNTSAVSGTIAGRLTYWECDAEL